ncbi:MAG: leucine-rich repeat protein [Lachnospiraceae bacterium]|nr:leucine-rich repeat protein [Lachnospiraceae bacterium]
MKSGKKLTALILAVAMVVSNMNTTMIGAATAKATTLRLEQTEGSATLKNANGTAKTIKAGMKLYNGDDLSTDKSSYAYISLDSTKAVKVDESSSVTIKQNGTENEVFVNSGSLMFNVTVPLAKKESLNIRTSTMVTGVRGTIGFADKISETESEIYILEGKVELTSIDDKIGNSKSVFIQAGEKGVCRRVKAKFDKENDTQVPEVIPEKFTEENIPDYVVIEIGRNLDIQNRLRKVGVLDVDKILEIYKRLGDKGTYITLGTPVTPNSVSPNRPAVTSNRAEEESSGGGGAGGGGGGGNAGNTATQTAAPVITVASVTGGGNYTYGDVLDTLSVNAEIDSADAITTYQWYMADNDVVTGNAIDGATAKDYTPESTIGTKYYYCVVTSKAKADETKVSKKESSRVAVTVEKQTQTEITAAPAEPVDRQIGFNTVTLEPVTTLASVGFTNGLINAAGGKITLANTKHSESDVLRIDTPVFNDPGRVVSEDEVEYAKSTDENAPTDDDKWQKSRTFTGLDQGTTYYFFARLAATETTKPGRPSAAITITTKTLEGSYLTPVISGNGLPEGIYFETNLDGYDGSVSPNAIVKCIKKENVNVQTTTVPEIEIPGVLEYYDIHIKVTELADEIFGTPYLPTISPEKIVLPDTLERIGDNAFQGSALTEIIIPDSVKYLGEQAFSGCNGLISVEIGDGVEVIKESTFNGCIRLTSVVIGDGVETLELSAFYGCSSLTSVEFGENVKTIGDTAFNGCSSLEDVTFDKNLETIGTAAFCATKLKSVSFNSGLKNIGNNAFMSCTQLKEVSIPSSVVAVSGNTWSQSPFKSCSNIEHIYCELDARPEGWGEHWNYSQNENDGDERFSTLWYKADTTDATGKTVRVYSADALEKQSSEYNKSRCTSLYFDAAIECEYYNYITSYFLEKLFETYDTVIIPEGNVAILDTDLTIQAGKTLVVNGDMSTGSYLFTATTIPNYVVFGTLTNEGQLIVHGNLYTANNRMSCTRSGSDSDFSAFSTIVSKTGTIDVSDHGYIGVSFVLMNIENGMSVESVNEPREGLEISNIVLSGGGKIDLYGYDNYGSSWNHKTDFSAATISGLVVDPFSSDKITYTLSCGSSASATDNFGLKYSCEGESGSVHNHKMTIVKSSDDSVSGVIYNEAVPYHYL